MSNIVDDAIQNEVDELVALATRLASEAARASSKLGPERIQELALLVSRGGYLVRRSYGVDSTYQHDLKRVVSAKYFNELHSNNHGHVSELAGILRGVQQDIKSGLLNDFRRLVQAEIFADYLEMAEHLLNEGYKDAAAVLLGATLEDSLRKIGDGRGIPVVSSTGKPLTMEPLNVALAKDGAYGPLVQKQVTTWANLRNDAAHGHFDKYDKQQVAQMLLFVQKFCGDYMS